MLTGVAMGYNPNMAIHSNHTEEHAKKRVYMAA